MHWNNLKHKSLFNADAKSKLNGDLKETHMTDWDYEINVL